MAARALAALTRPAKHYERPGLSADEIEEIREAFKLFDADEDGCIDPRELKEAMQSLGLDVKSGAVFNLISQFDRDADRRIDFEDFLELMTAKISDRDSKEDITKVFRLFDVDGKGFITIRELSKVSKELGETLTDSELQEMIERADTNGDGKVTAEDFYAIMTRSTLG